MKTLTQKEVVTLICRLVKESGLRPLARELQVSPTLIKQVTTKQIPPSPKILKALGIEKRVSYVIV